MKAFADLQSIGTGAGDVAGGFVETVLGAVGRKFYMTILFFVPLLVYCFVKQFRNLKPIQKQRIFILPLIAVLVTGMLCTVLFVRNSDRVFVRDEFNFNNAVGRFGLLGSFVLEGLSNPAEEDFMIAVEEITPEIQGPSAEGRPEYNRLNIDFKARAKEQTDSVTQSVDAYVASVKATKKNEYTGMFKGKNLILITAEAFSAEAIDPKYTPTLYRMATRGIQFADYYQPAWGGSTSTGEYSVITGLIPTAGVKSIKNTIGKDMAYTLGNQLRAQGYFSAAYHNGSYTYYDRHLTHENLGYDSFMGIGNGMEEGVQKHLWPESDVEMMAFTVPQYIDQRPFSVYYMSVSGHCLYNFGGNDMAEKNRELVADMEASTTIRAYMASQIELDRALELLIEQLDAAGITDDTVIVIASDHYPYGLEKSEMWCTDKDYLEELYGYPANTPFARDHSAWIVWSGCLEDKSPIVVDTPTYSLDIVPTLSNLFGIEYDSRLLVGRDALSDADPLVIFADYSWITDKGRYRASNGVFTPNEGVEIPEGYVEQIKASVKNRFVFSKNVIACNYYSTLKEYKP
ncbi:MAG: LTA synthase family protein [Clostridia bacterium]|nr:LTA synthase family protein [Clostridia bacterium]